MGWHGRLSLTYTRDGARTIAHDRHEGPLRVLQRLYPEGDAICHHVLVHPPGGLVGGDVLDIEARLGPDSHALVTTPGATRFYRSTGAWARQQVDVHLAPGARLDWLPLETIVYDQARAENHQRFVLAPGAEMFGWDLLALGLPAAGGAWTAGAVHQHLELAGTWLEQARIDAGDTRLLDSPLGWHGHRTLGTLWFGTGGGLTRERADALLELWRELLAEAPAGVIGGATRPQADVVLVRLLGPRVEPVFERLATLWSRAREQLWGLPTERPRLWRL